MPLKSMNLSYFKAGGFSKEPSRKLTLDQILTTIKSGNYEIQNRISRLRQQVNSDGEKNERYDTFKKQLPAFTTAGVFKVRNKNLESITSYSQLTILDIDKLLQQKVSVHDIRQKIAAFPEVVAGFTSPGGDGFKIIIKIDSQAEHHEWATMQVMKHFEKHLAVEIDPSGKDISRLCFFSFDPDIYINTAIIPFKVSLERSMNEKIKMAISFTEKKCLFKQGSRNHFIYVLCCNLNRLGVPIEKALEFLQSNYPEDGFNESEVEYTTRSAYRNTNEFGKWKKYDSKLKSIGIDDLDMQRIDAYEKEMGLDKLLVDEQVLAHMLLTAIEEEDYGFVLDLACSRGELLKEMLSNCNDGQIVKCFFTIPDVDRKLFEKEERSDLLARVKDYENNPFNFSSYREEALRIAILRFKIQKIKLAFHQWTNKTVFLTQSSLLKTQRTLEMMRELHNTWVSQVKDLFTSFEESRL